MSDEYLEGVTTWIIIVIIIYFAFDHLLQKEADIKNHVDVSLILWTIDDWFQSD